MPKISTDKHLEMPKFSVCFRSEAVNRAIAGKQDLSRLKGPGRI